MDPLPMDKMRPNSVAAVHRNGVDLPALKPRALKMPTLRINQQTAKKASKHSIWFIAERI